MSLGTSAKERRGEILPSIETTLEIVKASVAGLGIIGLEAAIGGLLSVVTALKNMRGNEENLRLFQDGVKRFHTTITDIRDVASKANGGTASRDLEERIAYFVKDLNAMADRAKEPLRAGIGRKFLMHKEYGSVVNQLNIDLHRAIQDFIMKGGAATEAAVEAGFSATRGDINMAHTELSNEISGVSEGVYRTQLGVQELTQHTRTWSDHTAADLAKIDIGLTGISDDLRRSEAAVLDQRLLQLPRAQARYNSQSRQDADGCLEGTRTKVLEEIYDWINSENPESPRILWLCGLAGIGKSTIAHTIAEKADADRRLGASFFFSRDKADRQNPHLVYPTIASQLARLDLELKKLIVAAVEEDHEIGTLVMRKQFEKLISEPLAAWSGSKGTIVIVMDALDECSPESGAVEVLVHWAAELPKIQVPLRILITSRPEFHIRRKFQSFSLRTISQPYILHDIEKTVVKEDIELFLRHRLNQIAEDHSLHTPWPSESALRTLVDRSGILFIIASTVVKFIQNGKQRNPETRLELLLKDDTSKGGSQYRDIDTLYMQVLRYALSANDDDDNDNPQEMIQHAFNIVLGAVVLLRDPLSSRSLESLLSLHAGTTQRVLLHLHSVLIVPESADDEIRLLHPSFHDCLTNPGRCPDPLLYVDPQENHGRLAEGCLNILLEELKHDPCHIGNIWLANSDISNLADRVRESIPSCLRYACRHFAFHLTEASSNQRTLANLVAAFCNTKLLVWVEALSLLGEVDSAIMSLQAMQDWYKKVSDPMQETLELLRDAFRMIMQFGKGIRGSSGHIYTSALPFSPACRLKQQYDYASRSGYFTRGLPARWDPNYCTIELPATVLAIAYSSAGCMIAVGTKKGGIHIFSSLTGAEIKTLETPRKEPISLVFSPDESRLVAAAGKEAMVWDIATGMHLVTLTGHTRLIQSVAFASDGRKLITGSCDDISRVWDSHNGLLISSHSRDGIRCEKWNDRYGHKCITHCITLSPDTSSIARGILYGVEIWDWHNNYPLRRLRDFSSGPCLNVLFLHGNTQLITQPRSSKALKIWDYQAGTLLKSIDIDGEIVTSPFGSELAQRHFTSGEVRIWDTKTWSVTRVLTRSKARPESFPLAFSPDGRTLAFALSIECFQAQVWEFTRGGLTHGHATDPLYDNEVAPKYFQVQVWEFTRGGLTHGRATDPLYDNEVAPESLAVSADGSLIVCCICIPAEISAMCQAGTILKVWDMVNGSSPQTRIFNEPFHVVACSPDGRRFLSYEPCSGELTSELRQDYLNLTFSRTGDDIDLAVCIVTVWDSDNIRALAKWGFGYGRCPLACFSTDGHRLAMMLTFGASSNSPFVLYITSHGFQAYSKVYRSSEEAENPELAFIDHNTKLLFGCRSECCIWDTKTMNCLFALDIAKANTASSLPLPWLSKHNHIMVQRSSWSGNFRIFQVSASITVETVITGFRSVTIGGVVNGHPTFLEVRDETLWEFNQSTERPLCGLPALWRRAFERRLVVYSEPLVVFGLWGGDIGVLNIDSLRRDCTSIRRARAA